MPTIASLIPQRGAAWSALNTIRNPTEMQEYASHIFAASTAKDQHAMYTRPTTRVDLLFMAQAEYPYNSVRSTIVSPTDAANANHTDTPTNSQLTRSATHTIVSARANSSAQPARLAMSGLMEYAWPSTASNTSAMAIVKHVPNHILRINKDSVFQVAHVCSMIATE